MLRRNRASGLVIPLKTLRVGPVVPDYCAGAAFRLVRGLVSSPRHDEPNKGGSKGEESLSTSGRTKERVGLPTVSSQPGERSKRTNSRRENKGVRLSLTDTVVNPSSGDVTKAQAPGLGVGGQANHTSPSEAPWVPTESDPTLSGITLPSYDVGYKEVVKTGQHWARQTSQSGPSKTKQKLEEKQGTPWPSCRAATYVALPHFSSPMTGAHFASTNGCCLSTRAPPLDVRFSKASLLDWRHTGRLPPSALPLSDR